MKAIDNPLVFPSKVENHSDEPMRGMDGKVIQPGMAVQYPGLSLRDWFAGKAMAAMLGTYPCPAMGCDIDNEALANDAYTIADAMLKARQA